MIAGFDTEFNRGDTAAGYGIALIPRTYVTNSYMNSTATTSGGYAGSYMHTTLLPSIATKLQTVLGSHLIQRRVILSNAVNTSAASGWTWFDAYCTLMSELQVYGSSIWGNGYDIGEACQKLPIFNFINFNQYGRNKFWLRAVASSTHFAYANECGYADFKSATSSCNTRPLIYIR